MNNPLRQIAVIASFFCLLAAATNANGQTPENGQAVVAQAARNLLQLSSLETEFRYRTEGYGQSLSGSGRYVQAGEGLEKLFRMELSAQATDLKVSQQIISGKQYFWIRRDFGPDRQTLARVNLRRLRMAITEASEKGTLDPATTWLGVVSLPKMLSSVSGWFVFEAPRETELADRNVLVLRGNINAEMRDTLLTGPRKQVKEQIPDAIELTLGTDSALPLFPYRIEYFKHDEAKKAASSMLTLDFFSVKVGTPRDPREFDYQPGDQVVEDHTRLFLERLGFQVGEEK